MVVQEANCESNSPPDFAPLLSRLCEYCRCLYEEEKQRTLRLNEAVKTYLAFLALVFTLGLFKYIPIREIIGDIYSSPTHAFDTTAPIFIGMCFAILTLLSFSASLLRTMLVLKVWQFERLCDPEETLARSVTLRGEHALLAVITADYAVAANRHHAINERKARLLSWGLFLLVLSLIMFAGAALLLNLLPMQGRTTP